MLGQIYRKKNQIPRVTKVPEYDQLQQKVIVKFKVPPRITNYSLLGRVTILSIALRNLPRQNSFNPNSPFVTIQCGDEFKATTEINSLAGI